MTATQTIREIDPISEIKALESIQKEVWQWSDLDTVPAMMFVAGREVGGDLIGAFDGAKLIGFVFGIVGREGSEMVLHSHLLGVLPDYRGRGVGEKLKLAQRDRALARGFKRITWTFDPLQSANAYLNFAKLGAVANQYKIDLYGAATSSSLHRFIGTDRLWVNWSIESQRVRERTQNLVTSQPAKNGSVVPLVEMGLDSRPTQPASRPLTGEQATIEIPADIGLFQKTDPQLAISWRERTREAFVRAIDSGYVVNEFYRLRRNDQEIGCYVLNPQS